METPEFRAYIAGLAKQCGAKSPYSSLFLPLSLRVEGAIVSELMKRHSGASAQAKQTATTLIEGCLLSVDASSAD